MHSTLAAWPTNVWKTGGLPKRLTLIKLIFVD